MNPHNSNTDYILYLAVFMFTKRMQRTQYRHSVKVQRNSDEHKLWPYIQDDQLEEWEDIQCQSNDYIQSNTNKITLETKVFYCIYINKYNLKASPTLYK
jgi:hypothetical protein